LAVVPVAVGRFWPAEGASRACFALSRGFALDGQSRPGGHPPVTIIRWSAPLRVAISSDYFDRLPGVLIFELRGTIGREARWVLGDVPWIARRAAFETV